METLIIDRSLWRTGADGDHQTGDGSTMLRNDEGFMCCLGFECLRRGISEADILGVGEPSEVDKEVIHILGEMVPDGMFNADWVSEAIAINDDLDTTIEEKEQAITALFENQGIEIKFINEHVNALQPTD